MAIEFGDSAASVDPVPSRRPIGSAEAYVCTIFSHYQSPCSCRQPPVEFIKDHRQALAEEFVNPAQAADLVERDIVEVVFARCAGCWRCGP